MSKGTLVALVGALTFATGLLGACGGGTTEVSTGDAEAPDAGPVTPPSDAGSGEGAVSTTDSGVDLLSVATHEAGHFFGLAHSSDPEASMFAAYTPGTITQRTLHADDVAGICDAYPAGTGAGECDTVPRHGFSTLCGADQKPGGDPPGTGGDTGDDGGAGGDATPDDGGAGGADGASGAAPGTCNMAVPSSDDLSVPETILLLLGYLVLRRQRRSTGRLRRGKVVLGR